MQSITVRDDPIKSITETLGSLSLLRNDPIGVLNSWRQTLIEKIDLIDPAYLVKACSKIEQAILEVGTKVLSGLSDKAIDLLIKTIDCVIKHILDTVQTYISRLTDSMKNDQDEKLRSEAMLR
jgi:hypothetical protein